MLLDFVEKLDEDSMAEGVLANLFVNAKDEDDQSPLIGCFGE